MSQQRTFSGPIYQRIDEAYETLAPQARRVADMVLDHLGDIGTYSVAELAELSGVSIATVSRLFSAIGFEDFAAVKAHARALRSEGVPIAGAQVDDDSAGWFNRETDNLRKVHELISGGKLDEVSDLIVRARRVMVLGFRNSFPVAMHLRESLLQCRADVTLSPHTGQSLGEELATYTASDVVIVIGFRRRLSQFDDLMRFIATTGAATILIADATARRHAHRASLWLECPIDATGAFDSYAAAMSLSALIADLVLEKSGQAGQRHVLKIAGAFETLNELDGEDLGYRRYVQDQKDAAPPQSAKTPGRRAMPREQRARRD